MKVVSNSEIFIFQWLTNGWGCKVNSFIGFNNLNDNEKNVFIVQVDWATYEALLEPCVGTCFMGLGFRFRQ